MHKNLKVLIIIFGVLIGTNVSFAQAADNAGGDVLMLEEIKVEVKIEEPRVAITKSRKKPTFDHIELEKNFKPELLSILKSITYTSVSSGKVETIPDIKLIANKPRQLE